nr:MULTISPECIES: YbjP/YqhG family protein [unclassified Escherichia]
MNIKTGTITENGSKSVVGVILGDDSEPKNSLNVSLKKIDSNWKIISVTE